jgi:hypothetical protein
MTIVTVLILFIVIIVVISAEPIVMSYADEIGSVVCRT